MELVAHLPELLPGLLPMLSDDNSEIRSQATKLLQARCVRAARAAPGAGQGARPRRGLALGIEMCWGACRCLPPS